MTHRDGSKTSSRHQVTAGVLSSRVSGVYPIFDSGVRCAVSRLQSSCGPFSLGGGGDEETRTPDPLLAKEMLFRLIYVPLHPPAMRAVGGGRFWTRTRDLCLIRAVL